MGVLALGVLFLLLRSFVISIALGGMLGAALLPLVDRWEACGKSRSSGALWVTFAVALLGILPFGTLGFLGVRSGLKQFQFLKEQYLSESSRDRVEAMLPNGGLEAWIVSLESKLPFSLPFAREDILEGLGSVARSLGGTFAEFLRDSVSSIPSNLLGVGILILSLFFLLQDAPKLGRFFRDSQLLSAHELEECRNRTLGLCRSVLLASLVVGLTQSVIFAGVSVAVGRSDAALLGLLVFLGSFVPVVGASPLTLSVALFEIFFRDHAGAGLALLVAALIGGVADNIIRPMVYRGSANLHPWVGVLGVFGGLATMGFSGVFLGPIVSGLGILFLQMSIRNEGSSS
jgi:predicted PurR-regulated permease PerM